MIPDNIFKALKIFYDIVSKKNIFWILSGSTSLVIQGVDVKINDDIDILTDKKEAQQIDQLLSNYRIKPLKFSTTDKYQSYYGIYKINNITIDIMGEFQYRKKDGSWSKPNHNSKTINKKYKGMLLRLLTLEQELKEYKEMGRIEKAKKIKQAINHKRVDKI